MDAYVGVAIPYAESAAAATYNFMIANPLNQLQQTYNQTFNSQGQPCP